MCEQGSWRPQGRLPHAIPTGPDCLIGSACWGSHGSSRVSSWPFWHILCMAFLGSFRPSQSLGGGGGQSSCSLPGSPPASSPGSPTQVLTFSKGCLRSRFKEARSSWMVASGTSFVMHCGQVEHVLKPRAPQAGRAERQCTGPTGPHRAHSPCDSGNAHLCLNPGQPPTRRTKAESLNPAGESVAPGPGASPESAPALSCCHLRAFAPDRPHWQDSSPSP